MKRQRGAYRNRIELVQGTRDMVSLQVRKWGKMHGYGIAQTIRSKSGEVLQVETGSLYPALHRLVERQGWVTAKWKLIDSKSERNSTGYCKWKSPARVGSRALAADRAGEWVHYQTEEGSS
jgi:PadR family transcriptional regulator